jgi:hypothetical protein
MQRLCPQTLLSWQRALFPVFQHVIDYFTAPRTWGFFKIFFTVEQVSALSPWVIHSKPHPSPLEHGLRGTGIPW